MNDPRKPTVVRACAVCGAACTEQCDYPARTMGPNAVTATCKKPLCPRHRIIHAEISVHDAGVPTRKVSIGYCHEHHAEMKQRAEPIPADPALAGRRGRYGRYGR